MQQSQLWYHLLHNLHSMMASQRMSERFNKYLDPFVNLCHLCGHKPTSVLLMLTLWYDGEGVGTTEMYEKTLESEEHFQMAASSAIHLIPYSLRFDGSHDRISACDAIDLIDIRTRVPSSSLKIFPCISMVSCLYSH